MDKAAFERVAKRIDGYRDDMIELQKKLIATPALSPENGGDGEYEKSKILEPMIREIYDEVQIIKAPDERVSCGYRPNIIAKMKGKSDEKTIWIMAHMDVVPAGDEKSWNTDPWKAVIKDGKIFGRGAEDNHQGIVTALFAAKAMKEEGISPNYTMGALYVADEEVGSVYGAKFLVEEYKSLFGINDMIIVPDWGVHDGSVIEIAEKSVVWFRIKTIGKQSHAAFPENGINAHRAAAHLICQMENLQKDYPERDELFSPPTSTFEPTMKETNVPNINTVPGEDIVCFDCRLLPTINTDEFIKKAEDYFRKIEKEFNVKITCELKQLTIAPLATPKDSPLITLLSNAIKNIHNVDPKPVGIGGVTVAAHFRRVGIHTAVCGRMVGLFHHPNEYCIINNLIGDTKVWVHVFMQ